MDSKGDKRVAKRSFVLGTIVSIVENQLEKAGIHVNGKGPGDIQVHNDQFYYQFAKFALNYDRLAVGESYMDGHWSCDDLVAYFEKIITAPTMAKYVFVTSKLQSFSLLFFNIQTKLRAQQDIKAHYDIGNDLYKRMLDRSMNYSCGYWHKNVVLDPSSSNNDTAEQLCETLDEAQLNKMLLIGRKLNLKPGMKVLDIGCGWGYLAKFLALNFDVHVIGITISEAQVQYAKTNDLELEKLDFLRVPGLKPSGKGKYEFRLKDYRDVDEVFDRIVSVGMIEHIGKYNYAEFFDICCRLLTKEGLLLLHTIGISKAEMPQLDPWLNKYIFPGGMIPYHRQLVDAFFGKFIIEDWHNMGYNYYRTLIQWQKNFGKRWPELESAYDERFRRMWNYYLAFCAATFKTRVVNLWQIVLSKQGHPNGYISYR